MGSYRGQLTGRPGMISGYVLTEAQARAIDAFNLNAIRLALMGRPAGTFPEIERLCDEMYAEAAAQ